MAQTPLPQEAPMRFEHTVLQVVPELDAGGAERTAVEIAAAIVAAGGRALVASRGGRMEGALKAVGGEFIAMPAHAKNPATIWANAGRLAAIMRAERCALIHARSRAPGWSALIAARRVGAPCVATYHGAYEAGSPWKRLYNSSMARADLVIANSAFTGESIRRTYPQAAGRLVVIPRGADLARFDPARIGPERRTAIERAWGIAPEDLVVLAPGRLTAWKGQATAIEAFGRVAATGEIPGLRLVLAGDDQGRTGYRARLEGLVKELGIDRMVRIVGHCDDMPAALDRAAAVLAPTSRPEAFGRVVAEAGAMRRPAIASALGGHLETIDDGKTGLLVPPEDPRALADALARLLADAPRREKMGAAARARIERDFSVAKMQEATLAAYARLLAARRIADKGRDGAQA